MLFLPSRTIRYIKQTFGQFSLIKKDRNVLKIVWLVFLFNISLFRNLPNLSQIQQTSLITDYIIVNN